MDRHLLTVAGASSRHAPGNCVSASIPFSAGPSVRRPTVALASRQMARPLRALSKKEAILVQYDRARARHSLVLAKNNRS